MWVYSPPVPEGPAQTAVHRQSPGTRLVMSGAGAEAGERLYEELAGRCRGTSRRKPGGGHAPSPPPLPPPPPPEI